MDRSGHCIDKRDTRELTGAANSPTDYTTAIMGLGIGAIVVLIGIIVIRNRRFIVSSFRACCSERCGDGNGGDSPLNAPASNDHDQDARLDVDGPAVRGELPETTTEREQCALLPPKPEVLEMNESGRPKISEINGHVVEIDGN